MRTKSKVSNGFLKTKIILSILLSSFCFNHVLLSQEHEAAFSSTNPSIDGQIDNSEWQNANTYDIMFIRTDGYDTHYGKLYLQHNDIWLYVGIESEWISGWDVYMQLRFDGNNDNLLAGNSSTPHTDIQVEYPSPDGWSGYNNYQYIAGNNAYPTTEPTGTQRESDGSSNVTYEFSIFISDLNIINPNRTFGFYMLHGTDGTSEHNFEFPKNNIRNDATKWQHITFQYPLSNTPLKHYKSIKISPNPIIDELLVTVNQDVLFPVKIEIIDNKGVTVQKQLITTIHSKIDCRNLIEGIYCLRCVSINNEVFWTAKVIKL
jgi:hypothetical protein